VVAHDCDPVIHDNKQVNRVSFDEVVVAAEYVGPIANPKVRSSAHRGLGYARAVVTACVGRA
jgi:hypothetical protein